MIFLTLVIMVTLLSLVASTLNPVKMSLALMVYSGLVFMSMITLNSSAWMPAIFFMIFTGGIMIMFMMVSSLLPNEKQLKMKKILIWIILVSLTTLGLKSASTSTQSNVSKESKMFFYSNQSFEVLMMLVLVYFLTFVYIISKESSSLRTFIC